MSDVVESEVRIGEGDVSLTFGGAPYAEHIGARLEGPFIRVGDSIVLDGGLPAFFLELDGMWRGWEGTRTWTSAGGGLTLIARHNGVGRVLIEATFRSPEVRDDRWAEDAWSASAVVAIEAGALGRVGRELQSLRASDLAQ